MDIPDLCLDILDDLGRILNGFLFLLLFDRCVFDGLVNGLGQSFRGDVFFIEVFAYKIV